MAKLIYAYLFGVALPFIGMAFLLAVGLPQPFGFIVGMLVFCSFVELFKYIFLSD